MKAILNRMQERIMNHQKENGFETIFDFLNEDIEELKGKVDFELSHVEKYVQSMSMDELAETVKTKYGVINLIRHKTLKTSNNEKTNTRDYQELSPKIQ